MMKEKISVIVPVYNVKEYFERFITSVVGQTYQNIEVILVDDGSTDGSGELCDQWVETDGRIKVIHQENMGVSYARNIGLDHCTGDAIIFLDPDDEIESTMFEDMVFNLYTENVDVVCCGFIEIYDDRKVEHCPQKGLFSGEDFLKKIFLPDIWGTLWNKLFKKDIVFDGYGNCQKFFIEFSSGEDFVWLVDISKKCRTIYCVDKMYYHYYRRVGSITGNTIGPIGIDRKGLTEICACEQIVKTCSEVSRASYELAYRHYYWILMTKLKVADMVNNIEVSTYLCGKLQQLVKEYPIKTLHDYLSIKKTGIILWLKKKDVGRKVILSIENNFSNSKIKQLQEQINSSGLEFYFSK